MKKILAALVALSFITAPAFAAEEKAADPAAAPAKKEKKMKKAKKAKKAEEKKAEDKK
jgi:Ni/Co efflux regulator RcnB